MRVIGGILRHRKIKETNLETTRETQDRVREAIFNSLNQCYGKTLDLFCGSGAMAIEAYSRGSNYLVLNDLNSKALEVAKSNLDSLGIKEYELYNKDYLDFIRSYNKSFDFIFLDPPYKMDNILDILTEIIKYNLLNKDGTIIFEMASTTDYKIPEELYLKKEKRYGKKKVIFLKMS